MYVMLLPALNLSEDPFLGINFYNVSILSIFQISRGGADHIVGSGFSTHFYACSDIEI